MREKFILGLLLVLVAACNPLATSETDPTQTSPPPSATPLPLLDDTAYGGPLIGRVGSGLGETEVSECDEACMLDTGVIVEGISAEARPLTAYEMDGLAIGIPEGYSPLQLSNETLGA